MFKTEKNVTDWIYSFITGETSRKTTSKRNLNHLHDFLATIDNPHLKLKTVHVAGTNGKGSTVAYIRQSFMESGYKVATFTSPFITCFGERMSINNVPMPEDKLIYYAEQLKALLPVSVLAFTYFDILTLISFLYFLDEAIDIAIYETGIGGRLDSTNVIQPLATAITNVGHDHADVLGDTQLERAMEKLGIVKKDVPLFTTEEDPFLIAKFDEVCQNKQAELYHALKGARLRHMDESGVNFEWGRYKEIEINMHGEHQFKNACLAVHILDYLKSTSQYANLDPTAIQKTKWQGRFEFFPKIDRPVVIDGAHNIEGIRALISTVQEIYPNYVHKYVFSALDTKDYKQMIDLLAEDADRLSFVTGTHSKAIDAKVMYEYHNHNHKVDSDFYQHFEAAVDEQLSNLKDEQVLVFCGSLYFISDVRRYLFEEDGRFLI